MIKLFQSVINKKSVLIGSVVLFLLGIVGAGMLSVVYSLNAVRSAQKFELTKAANQAQRALYMPRILSTLTLGRVPIVETWKYGLQTVVGSQRTLEVALQDLPRALTNPDTDLSIFHQELTTLSTLLNQTTKAAQSSSLLDDYQPEAFDQLTRISQGISAADQLFEGTHRYLFIFQNSNELRATGGFMGSYARLTIANGKISQFEIQDIYVPDGQTTAYLPAPTGVAQYLSDDGLLHLPDANWSPDFPTAAQQIMSYFAASHETQLEGVVAINLQLMEDLLTVTGPIEVKDYDVTVTTHNFADIARADRVNFFPGSQQKKHFLSQFFTQFLLQVQKLPSHNQKQLVTQALANVRQKNIFFYSQNPNLQSLFFDWQLAGNIFMPAKADNYVYLVESNVGINKANRLVDRSYQIVETPSETIVEMKIVNRNVSPDDQLPTQTDEADHLGYVNYQRVLLVPQALVTHIQINDQFLPSWDSELITSSQGQTFQQIGFLVTVPEQKTATISIFYTHPDLPPNPTFYLQKQPGISSIPVSLIWRDQAHNFDLNQDLLLTL